jgi:hypothetical protein
MQSIEGEIMIFKVTFQPDGNVVIYSASRDRRSTMTWSAKIGGTYTSRNKGSGGSYATIHLTEIDVEHQRVYGPCNNGRGRSMTLEQFVRSYAIPNQVREPGRPATITAQAATTPTQSQSPAELAELIRSVDRIGAVGATVAAQSRRTNDLLLKISNTLDALLAAWTKPEQEAKRQPVAPSSNGSLLESTDF